MKQQPTTIIIIINITTTTITITNAITTTTKCSESIVLLCNLPFGGDMNHDVENMQIRLK